jgi:hypothetical protein
VANTYRRDLAPMQHVLRSAVLKGFLKEPLHNHKRIKVPRRLSERSCGQLPKGGRVFTGKGTGGRGDRRARGLAVRGRAGEVANCVQPITNTASDRRTSRQKRAEIDDECRCLHAGMCVAVDMPEMDRCLHAVLFVPRSNKSRSTSAGKVMWQPECKGTSHPKCPRARAPHARAWQPVALPQSSSRASAM